MGGWMPIRNLTLGLCLLFGGAIEAQSKPYEVKSGDTVETISSRHHVPLKVFLRANHLKKESILKVGRELVIPSAIVAAHKSHHGSAPKSSKLSSVNHYTVRNGDFDWNIARKNDLSVYELHLANAQINWSPLHVGAKLVIPSHNAVVAKQFHPNHAVGKSAPAKLRSYSVKASDNDWILAHRLGMRTGQLHAMNPSVNWKTLHPGQHILVPTGSALAEGHAVARIKSHYAVVATDDVTIRSRASKSGESITTVDRGTKVTVLDRDGEWYRLRFPKGTEGWVRGDFLKSASAPKRHHEYRVAQAERRQSHRRHHRFSGGIVAKAGVGGGNLLKTAVSYSGVRYQWGSMSRSGTDCSGFTSQVFKRSGVKLPRTSQEQSGVGQKIDRSSMKAGDLVFFHTTRGKRVSHVGIYMGNGKFIHASSGGGQVQVNSLADGYYHNRFVTARRVAKKK